MRSIFLHRVLIGLLGLSLLLKALVPAGFMPDVGALSRGVVRMTICSAYGAQTLLVDKNQNKINPQHQQKHSHDKDGGLCPFASVPVFTPQAALLVFALLLLIAAVVTPPFSINHIRAALNRAAQSRAPPALQN